MTLVTVVVAVYNRTTELRRALASLVAQTEGSFECLVVDDGSTIPIGPVVAEFDERFVYVRSDINRGPITARYEGFSRAKGSYVALLDSDNQFFPWALERATYYLSAHDKAAGVAGLYLFDGRLRARVPSGTWMMTPEHFAKSRLPGLDCVGFVRRQAAQEWLELRDYHSMDFALWLTFHLKYSMLFVDEVWGRYDSSASDRVTTSRDPRTFSDSVKFVEEFRPLVGKRECPTLDEQLAARWFVLVRNGRKEDAAVLGDWLRERGNNLRHVFANELVFRVRRKLLRSETLWMAEP